jgi:hypothetical protein
VTPRSTTAERADRDELERWKRELNLAEFAGSRGYRIDRRQSTQRYVVMRFEPTDDKIIISRRGSDQHWVYYSVRDPQDNGTVVDFIQRRSRTTLGEVRKELRAWSGTDRPKLGFDDYLPTLSSLERDRGAVERAFGVARSATNSAYLNSRGIRPETLQAPRFRDAFRVDSRGNVLFPHRDAEGLCGFESRNHTWTSFASGGRKALWTSQQEPTDTKLVLVESAIDGLSHYQLRPDPATRYGSTAGQLGEEQLELVRRSIDALAPGSVVALAFDTDVAGDKLAAAVAGIARGVAVERQRSPVGKDWNDALKHRERDYIASLVRGRSLGLDRGGP